MVRKMKLIDLDTDKEYLLDGKYKVVPIVRCKDCKYQHRLGAWQGWCDRVVFDNGDYRIGILNADDSDYCSYGVKKEENE